MYTKGLVSIVIPARNEPYLTKTIRDLLAMAYEDIEIIAVCDGYWPEEIVDDKRVVYLRHGVAQGMRASINDGVAISHGEYILKCDAHTMWDIGYDKILKASCEDNWVVVPRRYALDPVKWEREKRSDNKYPVDYMYLSSDLKGEIWTEKNNDPKLQEKRIDDLMSAQGSAWFMKRSYYDELELLDEETYGKFYREFQEIGLKAWLSGGRVVVNKNVSYSHWHKTDGRGYSMDKGEEEKAELAVRNYIGDNKEKFEAFLSKFRPIPTWKYYE